MKEHSVCLDKYPVRCHAPMFMHDADIKAVIDEFISRGLAVSAAAIQHNYSAWRADFKSGYRDEENGTHLFTPCGCNRLRFDASILDDADASWQRTYTA